MVPIRTSRPDDLAALFDIWSRAVRATHHFLTEADLAFYSEAVRNEYLPNASFWVAVDSGDRPMGFVGVAGDKIDSLFVEPDQHGKGIGRRLVEHALREGSALSVDVNVQNRGAQAFYRRMGFQEVGRSDVDGTGRPYPLIHMKIVREL
jgi:putative acetyltransferase